MTVISSADKERAYARKTRREAIEHDGVECDHAFVEELADASGRTWAFCDTCGIWKKQ
ncbi:MAG: hypothetical protein ACRETG_02735 [Steroidobacteraceae bacterium]